jgi:CRP-like cAMP-binding protein
MSYHFKRFGIVNSDIVNDPNISLTAKGLYSLLCTYADDNRTCYPSIETLASESNVCTRTISRLLKELKKNGSISRNGRIIHLR